MTKIILGKKQKKKKKKKGESTIRKEKEKKRKKNRKVPSQSIVTCEESYSTFPLTKIIFGKIIKKQKQKQNHMEKHCSNQQCFFLNYKTKFSIRSILKN